MFDSSTATSYDKLALRRLINCIKEVRKEAPEMQVQTLQTLLTVALEPGITMGN